MKNATDIRGRKRAFASMAVYACVLLVSVLAGCNNGFSVLTESDLKYIPIAKCFVFEPTLTCAVPLPDAQVCGHQPLFFSDADASETYHRVSLDRKNWIEAVSGVTTFSAVPGFAAVPCGSEFTFYMTGENLCNSIGVDVVKLGLTLAITSPASGAQVCGHNRITFTDSDTLETAWEASVNGTSWVAFASNSTRLYQVPGFSAAACDSDFTLLLRGTDGCNQTSISLHKKGVTISVSSPSTGASVCSGNTITFTDSDTLETVHQASVDGSTWTAFTSGMTYSSISGFGAVSSPFTLYIRGNSAIDSCNHVEVANLTKIAGTTITISSPLPDATVEGTDTVTFSDSDLTTHDISIDNSNWYNDADSGVTTLDEIPGFSALPSGSFTIYVRGDNNPVCNIASVSVVKGAFAGYSGTRTIVLNTKPGGANVAGDVSEFPVLIRLTSAQSDIFTVVQSDGRDIRFSSATYGELDYEIERWDKSGNLAEVWVRFPLVNGNCDTDQFTMYFGNATAPDGQNPAGVFNSSNGYAGVWHMGEDPSGGTIADSTDNGIDGTPGGMVAGDSITGQVGKGLNFDGANNIVSMGANTLLQPDSITVSFWIERTTDWSGTPCVPLFAKESNFSSNGWQYYIDPNSGSEIGASLYVDGINYFYTSVVPNTFYPINNWVYIILTFETTGNTGAIYKNGVSQSVSTIGTLSTITDSVSTITKIAQDDSTTWFWTGRMDELRISSVARSADWVKLSYENQKTGQSLVTIQP